jgi:hypothetical protein
MGDLITSARAKYNLNNMTTTAAEDTTIAALVTACSKAIKKFCGREFDSQQFDELYPGNGYTRLLLRQFPVISVSRVAYAPTTVLRIRNTSASNQRATVAVTSSGLSLTRVASGTSTTDTSVTWAGNATLSAVATAVNALGNGWTATVADASYNNRASADHRAILGAFDAMNVDADLTIHLRELTSFDVDTDRGILILGGALVALCDVLPLWSGGRNAWRVVYTAGYATVPEDVQEACAQWVAALFWQTKRDPGLVHENIPGVLARWPFTAMPAGVRAMLLPYKDRKVA